MRRLTRGLVLAVGVSAFLTPTDGQAASPCGGGGTGATGDAGGTLCIHASSPGHAPRPNTSSPRSGSTTLSAGGGTVHLPPPPPVVVGALGAICPGVYVSGACPSAPPAGPGPRVALPPDPGRLAVRAFGRLHLALPRPHTAPAYPDREVVGVEAWMWVAKGQWRALSKSVTAGPTTVRVQARPSYVVWHTGEKSAADDGFEAVKRCYDESGATRAWRRGMTDEAQTPCGYTYSTTSEREPGGEFHLRAALMYTVDWTCTGACTIPGGSLGEVSGPVARARLESVQRQTVVVR